VGQGACSTSFVRRLLALVVLLVPVAAARAQNTGGGDSNAGASSGTASASGNAAPTSTEAKPPQNITGYGYSDRPASSARPLAVRSGARSNVHHAIPAAGGPVATLPGFEMLAEGGSRLFVELSQSIQIEERHARGTLTYVLKNAHVTVHNNQNPLVTVHFNTPVTSARLVPSGRDLLFIIDLRAAVTPTWKLNPGKEGSAVLNIDFPKGSYVSQQ
jgi:hypothetical protein